jgi:hypothetical protein
MLDEELETEESGEWETEEDWEIYEEATPRGPGRVWRIIVPVLAVVLTVAACGIIGMAFVQGSWWYSYGTDQALDYKSRSQIEAIVDDLEASGAAPEALTWLNAALEPNADSSAIRAYLASAQEALEETGDPEFAEAARELETIIESIRPTDLEPYPPPTLEWPDEED